MNPEKLIAPAFGINISSGLFCAKFQPESLELLLQYAPALGTGILASAAILERVQRRVALDPNDCYLDIRRKVGGLYALAFGIGATGAAGLFQQIAYYISK